MMQSQTVLLVLMCLSLLIGAWSSRNPSILGSIINRWIRWIILSFGLSSILVAGHLTERPQGILTIVFFLGWFLLESIDSWLIVRNLSRASMRPFPLFRKEAEDAWVWPNLPHFIRLKDWLRQEGFQQVAQLRTSSHPQGKSGDALMVSVWRNPSSTTQAQMVFMPGPRDTVQCFQVFSSRTADGARVITDNVAIAFGGFYPENWDVCRRPLVSSIKALHQLHQKRLKLSGGQFVPFPEEALEDLNRQQVQMLQVNIERGFLVPPHLEPEMGQLTSEGCYRLWKELWFLHYLGRTSFSR